MGNNICKIYIKLCALYIIMYVIFLSYYNNYMGFYAASGYGSYAAAAASAAAVNGAAQSSAAAAAAAAAAGAGPQPIYQLSSLQPPSSIADGPNVVDPDALKPPSEK